jgi:hypothetical protein
MKRFKKFLIVSAVAFLASGCTKQGAQRVTDPGPGARPEFPDVKEARWITAQEEIRDATARASKSPLMLRAVQDGASDPALGLLRSGILGAIGTMQDGASVRFTLLPYQFSDDPTHAVYFALVEVNGVSRVESFELIRNRRPSEAESGFDRVNSGEHGLWMKPGPTYVQGKTGIELRAPERFNFAKFGACFIPVADRLLSGVHDGCASMGDFPGCVSIGSTAAVLGAAVYCAFMAWNG